jgi:hypothetical protein
MHRIMATILICLAIVYMPLPLGAETIDATPLDLIVFLYDGCGDCGVNSPGCGDCQEIVRYHGIIKKQLQNKLYTSVTYRMLNCRMLHNKEAYEQFFNDYEVEEKLYGHLPTTFIGHGKHGVYLVGEPMLAYVGKVIEAYERSEDIMAIQAWIDETYEQQDALSSKDSL